ncbi:hypothetical protein [Aerolutibacter daejeonensis]|uniref:hypothetical protein n=1 Tax=Aerolutibacter daejeonensis TaxID=346181 RepID=UPI00068F7E50|nr:hypothetical protein [Lysobacter daejeonensis]
MLALMTAWPVAGAAHTSSPPLAVPQTQDLDASRPAAESPRTIAEELVLDAMGEHRLVLLGELHGTHETPALVAALLSRLGARDETLVLALEIARQEQSAVDDFLASNGDAVARSRLLAGSHWQAIHDGRDSASMLALIEHVRRLRQGGRTVQVVLFDDLDAFSVRGRRDALMAEHLRATVAANPQARVLVLTGNIHAMVRSSKSQMVSADDKPVQLPGTAGDYLADLNPWSLRIDGAEGSMWVCFGARDCGVRPVRGGGPQPRPTLTLLGNDEPWDARLLLPQFTASPPAITSAPASD